MPPVCVASCRWAREEAGSDEITLDRLDDGALEGFYLALADELGPEREATIATYVAAARAFLRHCLREGSLTTLSIERAVERLHGVRAAPRYRAPRVDDALAIIVDYVKNELPARHPCRRRRGDAAALRPRSRPACRCSTARACDVPRWRGSIAVTSTTDTPSRP